MSSRGSDLWVPGAAAPSIDDFVERLHTAIEAFGARRGWSDVVVEVQLHDGTNFAVHSIRPEPGYGFLTLCPYPEDEELPWPSDRDSDKTCPPEEIVVPVGSIVRIKLGAIDEPRRLGFSQGGEAGAPRNAAEGRSRRRSAGEAGVSSRKKSRRAS